MKLQDLVDLPHNGFMPAADVLSAVVYEPRNQADSAKVILQTKDTGTIKLEFDTVVEAANFARNIRQAVLNTAMAD